MKTNVDFLEELSDFEEAFLSSNEYKELKRCNKALYLDEELLKLSKEKEEIESQLNYLMSLSKEQREEKEREALIRYNSIKEKIYSLPSVVSYLKAYDEVKKIKNILNTKIVGELRWFVL